MLSNLRLTESNYLQFFSIFILFSAIFIADTFIGIEYFGDSYAFLTLQETRLNFELIPSTIYFNLNKLSMGFGVYLSVIIIQGLFLYLLKSLNETYNLKHLIIQLILLPTFLFWILIPGKEQLFIIFFLFYLIFKQKNSAIRHIFLISFFFRPLHTTIFYIYMEFFSKRDISRTNIYIGILLLILLFIGVLLFNPEFLNLVDYQISKYSNNLSGGKFSYLNYVKDDAFIYWDMLTYSVFGLCLSCNITSLIGIFAMAQVILRNTLILFLAARHPMNVSGNSLLISIILVESIGVFNIVSGTRFISVTIAALLLIFLFVNQNKFRNS